MVNLENQFLIRASDQILGCTQFFQIPLWSASIFFIIHHSTRFRADLLMASEVDVGLLTVCNFCHEVSKTRRPIYSNHKEQQAIMYIIKAVTSTLANTTPNPNIRSMQHTAAAIHGKPIKCCSDEKING